MGRRAQSSLQERFLGERVPTQSPLSRFGASGVPWKAHERLKSPQRRFGTYLRHSSGMNIRISVPIPQ